MRKLFYYSLLCAVWLGAVSCKNDDAPTPPKPSFTVDKVSGLSGATEFTFTVTQVDGDAVSLLPYGVDSLGLGGILISTWTDGKAVIKFTYSHVGVFQAVAVANNHSKNGKDVKNTFSDATAITITSDQDKISEFILADQTATIDDVANTIAVTVPFGTPITAAKPTYTASDYSTVTVGSTTQSSGNSANNFTSPVLYKVTAANGSTTKTYTVTVTVTPVETNTQIKSFSGKSKGKDLGGAVDNTAHTVVLYDVSGSTDNDSVTVKYELTGKFSYLIYNTDTKHLEQSALLNLTTSKPMVVHSQDSVATTQAYTLHTAQVPNLAVKFTALDPQPAGTSDRFTVPISVLKGTDVTDITTQITWSAVPAGVSVTSTEIKTVNGTDPFSSGDNVDYSNGAGLGITQDVQLLAHIHDNSQGGFDYIAVYTISVTVVQ